MNDMSFRMNAALPDPQDRAADGAVGHTRNTASDLVITLHEQMSDVETAWRTLETPAHVSLHQGFDWCAAWVEAHDSRAAILHGTIGGKPVFVLPLEIIRNRLFSTARFIGAPHSNINTGLFAGDLGGLAADTLAGYIAQTLAEKLSPLADAVTLENIPFDWRGHHHPLASLPSVRNQNSAFQLLLHPSFEETIAQVNAKRRRKKFRTSERRLEAFGGYEHIIAQTIDERRDILDLFFRQKAIRFQTLGLPNVFRDAETQAFFHALTRIEQVSPDVTLQLHAIRLKGDSDGRIVAIAGLSRKGDHVICQFGSIDEDFAGDASPGELLFNLMIRTCCESGAALFDFGIGDQLYKRSWCNVETVQSDITLPLTGRGRLAVLVHKSIVRLKSRIKKNPAVYALLQRARRVRDDKPVAAPEVSSDD
ncbi:GNAT family N-acetyltransferase [Pararhizobium sp.]|uniref:GNAT family N-acetyltransferase n=1 Tax=Pararhizobium sp. TaxID=1977563 RepID=UPI00271AF914|nr:GNAT family N-acetyltransferase [Pararhizobium sp.]MDO9415981.1 GNAT family N-acetyltransferase [Pararhizobium sp.]